MAIEMKKTIVKMTKPLYLRMSILDISKILMYKFWYDYSIETMQNYFIQILIVLLFTLKLKIFFEDIFNDVKNGLIRLTIIKTIKDLFQ